MAKLRRYLVFLALAFSFGGFTFYASIVVPIGGAVLGKTTQGFVTRQVTNVINSATVVTILLLIWEAIAGRAERSRTASAMLLMLIALAVACCLVLIILHSRLDSYMDLQSLTVNEHDVFYRVHRIYLWTSTLQWLATLPILWIVANSPVSRAPSAH